MLEIALRRLAAYLYVSRMHDTVGGSHMLAVQAPGGATDVAPTWLVDTATSHSKAEFQRSQRVLQEQRRAPKGKKGDGKGDRAGPKG